MQCRNFQKAVDSIHNLITRIKAFSMADTSDPPRSCIGGMPAPHVAAAQAMLALGAQPTIPKTFLVKPIYDTAVGALSTLCAGDPTLAKAFSQLRLWGQGRFVDVPLSLDAILNNKHACDPSLKEGVLEYLVEIILHGDVLCKALHHDVEKPSEIKCRDSIRWVLRQSGPKDVIEEAVMETKDVPSDGPGNRSYR